MDSPLKRLNIREANQSLYDCACMGPINGEPVCPCKMSIWDVRKEGEVWTMQTLYGDSRKPIE